MDDNVDDVDVAVAVDADRVVFLLLNFCKFPSLRFISAAEKKKGLIHGIRC